MRCKQCEYTLWNLKPGPCPECGRPFSPAEFDFIPNAVRFCCPHCKQDYYGTSEHGHLEPHEFTCVRCEAPIAMRDMVCAPAAGVDEAYTSPDPMPWIQRKRIGFIKGWLKTVFMSMFRPGRLMRADPGPWIASALWFLFLTTVFYMLPQLLLMLAFVVAFGGVGAAGGTMALGFAGVVGAILVLLMVWAIVWSLMAHGILRLGGPVEHGYRGTAQAIFYSSGANVLLAVPCVSPYLAPGAWLWWAISATLMLRARHRIGGLRAAVAVFVPGVLITGAAIGLFVWFANWMTAMSTTYAQTGTTSTGLVTSALVTETSVNGPPAHALELAAHGGLTPYDFVLSWTPTTAFNILVGEKTILDFAGASAEQQQAMLASEALPDGTIAHRVGDFVFTYHGIDMATANPNLWIVIASPDPDYAIARPGSYLVMVGKVDGTVQGFPGPNFPAALQAQNALRAQAGLAPLPDPSAVTHAQPATAP